MSKLDEQDRRIEAILGDDEDMDQGQAIEVFFKYLKSHLPLPCEVKGIEDFQWEERYVIGGWSPKEYEQLKKTQPSYTDRYQLLDIEQDVSSEWMMCAGEDLAAWCRRIKDGKEFYLGLSELKATDRKSPVYQLLDDYAMWFWNNR